MILDPTRRFLSGDENNSETADQFINDVEAIKNEGCGQTTLLLAHHTSKGGAGGRDQHASRGSSAFVDGARWQLVMAGLDPQKEWKYENGNLLNEDEVRRHLRIELTKSTVLYRISMNSYLSGDLVGYWTSLHPKFLRAGRHQNPTPIT